MTAPDGHGGRDGSKSYEVPVEAVQAVIEEVIGFLKVRGYNLSERHAGEVVGLAFGRLLPYVAPKPISPPEPCRPSVDHVCHRCAPDEKDRQP